MRVLVLSNKMPYPPKDGGSIATLSMLLGLREQGHELVCLAMNTSKHPFPPEAVPVHISRSIRLESVNINTEVTALGMTANLLFSRLPYNAVRFRRKSFRRRLEALLKEIPFDLIQLEGPYPGHYLKTIRKHSGARIALRAHNVEHLIWKQKARNEQGILKRAYVHLLANRLRRWETGIVNRADLLIPISRVDEKQFLASGFRGPVLTVPTGLDTREYACTPVPEKQDLFFIGALDWLPNQEGLCWFIDHVLDGVLAEKPELLFHIAGRNAPASFIRRLGHPQIRFHDEVEDARGFMQEHRLMVAPLLTGSGIRIKILEAMALGRPVVTTSKGAEGIDATSGKELIIADKPADFVQHCLQLTDDREMCQKMAADGRSLVRKNFDTFGLSTHLSHFYTAQA